MPIILIVECAGFGGTEVYVEGLARYLGRENLVEIVTLSGSEAAARNRFEGLSVTALNGAKGLIEFLKDRSNAVINLHLYASLWPAARAVRAGNNPLLITLHQPVAPWNAWHRLRWRLAVALADYVVGVSRACLQGFGPLLREARSSVISAPLPLDMLPAPSFPREKLRTPNILFVGRLSREKSLPTLLRAVRKIGDATLHIVGDGPERDKLRVLSKELDINTKFYGALQRDAVFTAMRRADIFVLPSKFEGLGIAAIEAMALGLPTVVSDFPAASTYIEADKTGLMFPIGNSDALASCLSRLILNQKLRKNISIDGASYVRKLFTPEAQYSKYIGIFKQMNSCSKYQRYIDEA